MEIHTSGGDIIDFQSQQHTTPHTTHHTFAFPRYRLVAPSSCIKENVRHIVELLRRFGLEEMWRGNFSGMTSAVCS